ncbi:hypothetical protein SUGI_0023690 [Cryptomeria japonica]|uniref:probable 4-hydroxy-tetrahydrodipicolinate reductase 1, chloroplastic n=1 Tax=Cryptomeria japonica TaxID=3369 RepID=UPI002408B572|nr:probable 4-hydroxy-tetrahydrodipicolinate reductase 1, chloroplastic [Cryptomeria japonica]GLJ05710.1 hypothetical protein SUGI_0023690 [Cryptomeria japonica]
MLSKALNAPQISLTGLQNRDHLCSRVVYRRFARNARPLMSTVKRKSPCLCVANAEKLENASTSTASKTSFPVMVNGCAGNMGRAVAEAALSAGLQLVPLSLTSPHLGNQKIQIGDVEVDVRSASEKDDVYDLILQNYPHVVVVDYTVPSAVNENAELYCRMGVPFVMGTTGGDREKLLDVVRKSNNYAVIAPQMGKQVVAFQAAMEIMAEQFPEAFSGYKLEVTESHQSSKVDTSGTAKAIVSCFQRLGVSYDLDQIKKVRDRTEQIEKMGVPENYLGGHAFHTYSLTSPDNTVAFQFQHNVCGRSIYAQGTVDAVLFLAKKVKSNAEKRLYNMIDVLREGNMR